MTARAQDTSLLTVIADAFEKNELMKGWFWRQLPLPDAAWAERKYEEFLEEITRWKGPPLLAERTSSRRRAAWGDIRIQQVGRGVMVWLRDGRVRDWWHDAATWAGDPMSAAWDWEGE